MASSGNSPGPGASPSHVASSPDTDTTTNTTSSSPRQSKKPALGVPAASLSPQPPPSLATLPPELQKGVMGFLPDEELRPLLSLSKALGDAAASNIRTLALLVDGFAAACHDAYALSRLLKKLSNLEELSIDVHGRDPDRAEEVILHSLANPSVGKHIRRLSIDVDRNLAHTMEMQLAMLLHDGRLPSLQELKTPYTFEREEAFVQALGQRCTHDLPSLTGLKGIHYWDAAILRRIWACCPLEQMTHLEATAYTQLKALTVYLQGHTPPRFAALRSLNLVTTSDVEEDRLEEARIEIQCILNMLVHDGAPKLKELVIDDFGLAAGTLVHLGAAIGQGKFSALSSLLFGSVPFSAADFTALMDGLKAHGGLRKLDMDYATLEPACIARLANALMDVNGGLTQLEGLKLAADDDGHC